MSRIIETGMFIRRYYNVWRIHYTGEISSLGRRKDNPIKLGGLKDMYLSYREIEKAIEGMGYIIKKPTLRSADHLIMVDLDDSEAINKIEKALACN